MQPGNTLSEPNHDDFAATMAAIAKTIDRYMRQQGVQQAAISPYLGVHRYEHPTEMTSYMQEPAVCLVVQGRKRVLLGNEEYVCGKGQYLIASIDLPLTAQIIDASKDKPYLALTLKIDQEQVTRLVNEENLLPAKKQSTLRGLAVSRLNMPIAQTFARLISMLGNPKEIPILAPIIYREILYRLLMSEQGNRIWQILTVGSRSYQIARTINWLTQNSTKQFKTDDLATLSGMSAASLRYYFQTVTAMSPLQFQKKLQMNKMNQQGVTKGEEKKATCKICSKKYLQLRKKCSRLFLDHYLKSKRWN